MGQQPPIHESERLDRRETERGSQERPADPSRGGAWIAGAILIVLGGMFLMRNTGAFDLPLRNWWALFILIPAVGAIETALRMYRSAGSQLNAQARGSLLVGLVLTFVSAMFLFDISWTFLGPVLIILVGIAIIINSMLKQ